MLHTRAVTSVSYAAFQGTRGFGYTAEEILILARSYMSVSEDPTTGTNQKASAFWTRASSTTRTLPKPTRFAKMIPLGEFFPVTGQKAP